jgi:hypothetical protein
MQDPRTESVLTSLGVRFEYVPEFPMAKLVSDQTTQVRREENQAPKPEVERYLKLLQAGAEFPPIVITKDGKVIDGNTRWGAFTRGRRTTIPSYRCDTTSPIVAKLIGVELNVVHGKRMEKAELAAWLAQANGRVTPEDAQRLTGWSYKTVQRVKEALKFDDRCAKLGIKLVTVLPEAVRAALMKITDAERFREMTILAERAGLREKDINEVVKEINELSLVDREAALRKIQELEADHREQIDERAAGLRASTPKYRQIALHLGWVIKQGSVELRDTNPNTAAKSQRYLEEAATVIKEALERYVAA